MIENLSSVKAEYISVFIGSVGLLIVSAIVLILCMCQKRSNEHSANDKGISSAESGVAGTKVNDVKVSVNDSVSPVANSETSNGVLRNSGGSPAGGSSPHPPGTNQRELPQPPGPSRSNTIGGAHQRLPVNVNGGLGSSNRNTIAIVSGTDEPEDDYDHLMRPGIKKDESHRSDYDHVTIGDDGIPKVKARESKEQHRQSSTENDYAEVDRENIYEGVKDNDTKVTGQESNSKIKNGGTKSVKDIEDPYASVGGDTKDELSDGSFRDIDPYAIVQDYPYIKVKGDDPPYSKVKDDPYSKVKDQGDSNASGGTFKDVDPYSILKEESESGSGTFKDSDPYSRVKEYEDDPYNKVVDDPYNKVKEEKDDPYSRVTDEKDDPYNRVKDDKEDPYNKVKDEKDDPYNKVKDEDPYNRVDDDGSASSEQMNRLSYQYSTVNKVANAPQDVSDSMADGEFSIENSTGEYAQVLKNRDNSNARAPTLQPPVADINRRSDTDPYTLPPEPPRRYNLPDDNVALAVHVDSVTMPTDDPVSAGGDLVIHGAEGGGDAPPLAAEPPKKKEPPYHKLTARESMASINARREMNTYEEVPENMYATVEGGSGDGVVMARANNSVEEHRVVVRNDVYSEIEDTGSRVPAPPSLDSLHLVTKTDCKNRLSAELEAHGERAVADSQVSPGATTLNRLSSGSTGVVNPAFEESDATGVILDPNYQTVRDCIPDCDGDMDPNYESVEEVKSKAHSSEQDRKMMMERKKKLHVYEEVNPGESVKVRERVLQTHMYEDLDGVKKEKEILEKNTDTKTKRKSDVWKRRSETEENERL